MLIGRVAELDQVRQGLAGSGLVVIVGPAGIGKSTLARAALGQPDAYREAGALATLAWSPTLVFRRLLRRDPPEQPDEMAGAVLRDGLSPLLLDDLQWADDASLDVVRMLHGRVPIIVTVRTGEGRSEFVAEALGLIGGTRVDLAGLPPDEARSLVDLLHRDLPEVESGRILDAADGNPLLLSELSGSSTDSPVLVSVLLDRMASLSGEGRQAIERLAVLGRPVSGETLGPGAAELDRSGLASEGPDGFTARHGLLAEVIVEGMGPRANEVRRELAPMVGDAEAAHLLRAAGDLVGARVKALEAAGSSDRRTRAVLLRLAVECAPDLDFKHRMEAARLFTAISQPDEARAMCAVKGRDALPPEERGGLLGAEAEAAWLQGNQQDCIDLVERALDDLTGSRTATEVRVLAGSTVAHTWIGIDGRPALERAHEAVRLADEIGEEQGYARSRLASVLLTAGQPGWRELYEKVIADARDLGDEDLRLTALISLILGHWVSGDPVAAEGLARSEMAAGPRQTTDAQWLSVVSYAAVIGVLSGRSRSELIGEFQPILEREPGFRSRPFLETSVVLALADVGDHVAARELASDSLDRVRGEPQWQAITLWAVVEAAWLAGRNEEAMLMAARVSALPVGDHPARVQARLVGAHAARELGIAPSGPIPSAVLPAWRSAPIEWAALESAHGGDIDAAIRGWQEAAEGWAGIDVRSEARCRWAAADLAAKSGYEDADLLLQRAEDHAVMFGLAAVLARVRQSSRAVGLGRRAGADMGAGGLTRREEDVLDLVAAGMGTTEIAAAMGLKPSTVESFIRAAMRKFSVSTRLAAAARLRQIRDETAPGVSSL